MKIKPLYSPVNHTKEAKALNIRKQYRVYLAEMESYKWRPMTFREWMNYPRTPRTQEPKP
jgi:hypothetical protein